MPFHGAPELLTPDEIRVDEVTAHEQQNHVSGAELPVDHFLPSLAGYKIPVVPFLDEALPLEQRQRTRQFVPVALIFVGVRIEDGNRLRQEGVVLTCYTCGTDYMIDNGVVVLLFDSKLHEQ